MPSAAAERKIAPMLVGFITFSSTATRVAPAQTVRASAGRGRRIAQSIPRVRWKPVSCVRTSGGAVKTGVCSGQRAISSAPFPRISPGSVRNDTGVMPPSSARSITSGLSATNSPLSGSARLTS